MPVDEATVLRIVCDNPACPGNDLDPQERTGWTFLSAEVYGQPTASFVFCSQGCTNTAGDALAAVEPAPSLAPPEVVPPPEISPEQPAG